MTDRHTWHRELLDDRRARYAARAFAEDALRGINRNITQASEEQYNRHMAAAADLDVRQARYSVRAFAEDPLRGINRDITQASEGQHNTRVALPADLRSRLVDECKRRAFEHHCGPQPHLSIKDARASNPVKDKEGSASANSSDRAVFNLAQHELFSKRAAREAGRSRVRTPSIALNRHSAHDSDEVQVFAEQLPSLRDMETATAHDYAARRGDSVHVTAQQTSKGLPSAANRTVTPLCRSRWKASQTPVAPSAPRTPAQSTFDKFDGPGTGSDTGAPAVKSSSESAAAPSITMPTPPVNGLNKFQGHPCNLRTPAAASKPTTITTPTVPKDKDYNKLEGLPFGWRKLVPGHSSDDFHLVSGKVPSAANGSPLHPDTVMDQLDDDLASTLGWDEDETDEESWDMGGLAEWKWVGEESARATSTK